MAKVPGYVTGGVCRQLLDHEHFSKMGEIMCICLPWLCRAMLYPKAVVATQGVRRGAMYDTVYRTAHRQSALCVTGFCRCGM